jgi:hypothetical protein
MLFEGGGGVSEHYFDINTPPLKSGQDFAPSQVENVIMRRFY